MRHSGLNNIILISRGPEQDYQHNPVKLVLPFRPNKRGNNKIISIHNGIQGGA